MSTSRASPPSRTPISTSSPRNSARTPTRSRTWSGRSISTLRESSRRSRDDGRQDWVQIDTPDVQLTIPQPRWDDRTKSKQGETVKNPATIIGGLVAAATIIFAAGADAQEAKHYRFAHDQQLNSGYSIAYDIFSAKLKELSKGTMLVDQYPGAQLGQ